MDITSSNFSTHSSLIPGAIAPTNKVVNFSLSELGVTVAGGGAEGEFVAGGGLPIDCGPPKEAGGGLIP